MTLLGHGFLEPRYSFSVRFYLFIFGFFRHWGSCFSVQLRNL
jgi:hypothetical protein